MGLFKSFDYDVDTQSPDESDQPDQPDAGPAGDAEIEPVGDADPRHGPPESDPAAGALGHAKPDDQN